MKAVVVLEWKFTPEDYFGYSVTIDRPSYSIRIADGSIEAVVAADQFDANSDMRLEVERAVNDALLDSVRNRAVACELSRPTMVRIHSDGHKEFILDVQSAVLTVSSQKVDLVLPSDGPTVLLKGVVRFGGRTHEGMLIQMVEPAWTRIIEMMQQDPGLMFEIPPRQWEVIIAGAYKTAGFEDVILTPRSGDLGRDIIATKRGIGTVRVIDQVKAYKHGRRVSADDVRALIGVRYADGASKAFLSTTSTFAPRIATDPTIQPYIPSQLELIDGAQLIGKLCDLAARAAMAFVDH
jgi:restriction system protein